MQKKQNPAARLCGAEVHLPRAMALQRRHHATTSGSCEGAVSSSLPASTTRISLEWRLIRARQAGRVAASFATGITTEISGVSIVGISPPI